MDKELIPRIIHYCWFGNKKKSRLAKKCISSWKKYANDYQYIEWNESNFDLSEAPRYVKEAYEHKKWAFVTDYVRLKVIYEYGGIYLDTDVEMISSFDTLLCLPAFFGFQNETKVATGLGFGATKGSEIIKDMLEDYTDIPFVKEDGTLDLLPCPYRNFHVFEERGLVGNNTKQVLSDGTVVFDKDVFSPIECDTKIYRVTEKTMSIHWYAASWTKEYSFCSNVFRFIFGQKAFFLLREKKIDLENRLK